MSARAIKHVCLAFGVLVLVVLVLRVWRRAEMDRKFDAKRLIGLSFGEVQRVVGPPDFVVENNIWLYFAGRDPSATLTFREGRLHTLEKD